MWTWTKTASIELLDQGLVLMLAEPALACKVARCKQAFSCCPVIPDQVAVAADGRIRLSNGSYVIIALPSSECGWTSDSSWISFVAGVW